MSNNCIESWGKIIYIDIIEPETTIYTDYFSDADGIIDETLSSSETKLEFIDLGSETKLVNHTEYASVKELRKVKDMGMLQGITGTWNRLEEHLNEVIY